MEGDLGWCCSSGSNNWDLHAVVRFACSGGGRVAPPSASDDSFPWLHAQSASEDSSGLHQPQRQADLQPFDAAAAASSPVLADPGVDDLCLQAFFAASPKPETPQPSSPRHKAPPADGSPGSKPRASGRVGGGRSARSKRKSKKSQVSKEVTRVPMGRPPADLWAWRKYGQKPIKGSPYPRGYYRCSTDKECKARKQVERCRTDSATLIVTYTGDHSHPVPLHRNSLAGTTRNKTQPPSPSPAEAEAALSASATDARSQGSPSASTGLSPISPLCSPSLGLEFEEDDDAIPYRLLLEGTEMEGEDDVLMRCLMREETAPDPNNHGCEDVMLFPKPDKPPSTTSTSREDGGAEAAPVMNIGEEKFNISGLSAWQAASVAAASSWG